MSNRVVAVRALAELKADVSTPDNEVNFLLSKFLICPVCCVKGCTPMYNAAAENHVDTIRALAELKADVNTPANKVHRPHTVDCSTAFSILLPSSLSLSPSLRVLCVCVCVCAFVSCLTPSLPPLLETIL